MRERYPAIEPQQHGMLAAGDGHDVYWEVCGNPAGKPALVLHGGPGSGCKPWHRQMFDPERYRVVLLDQRGCGRSTPSAGTDLAALEANTTPHLLNDIEAVRKLLEIDRWLVWGGSFGCELALAYAERHPAQVSELVLWGITTGRRSEADWLFRGGVGVSWRYGVANLGRRRTESVVQLTAFAHGIMMLLLLVVVRNDLLNDWRRSLPADTPNFFFINIPPDEHQAFAKFLAERGAQRTRALPMVRARMTHINGRSIDDLKFATPRAREFATRDQNITWAEQLGRDNEITAGKWFTPEDAGKPLVSVSTEYAQELDLKIGDALQFDVAGETQTAKVSSIRRVKWDSFQPNFFLMFAPGLLEGAQGTWMTAAHMDASNPKTIGDLVRRFPSVSVFNVDDLLRQVRSVIDKALAAVQSVFLFTLMAGLVVLIAAVQASREERRFESAILRTLGANRSTVLKGLLAEFATLGVLSGALAAAGASIAGAYMAKQVLQIPYSPDPWVWFYGLVGGGSLVCFAGWLVTRSVVNQPPVLTLRNS
jgi:putative ABC transport system permease protein